MKITIKYVFAALIMFGFTSCDKDEDSANEMEVIDDDPFGFDKFKYTQEEKDEEIEFIEQYVRDNSIFATKTASGLHYQILYQPNSINPPDYNDNLLAHSTIINAKTLDTLYRSNPEVNLYGDVLEMPELIEGVEEAMMLCGEGSVIRVVIPSFIAYGRDPVPQLNLEAKAILDMTFEVNLIVRVNN